MKINNNMRLGIRNKDEKYKKEETREIRNEKRRNTRNKNFWNN